jgi:uncharacterized membrane protein YjgN (DUF898 family)
MSFAADTPLAVPLSQPAPPAGPVRFMDRGGLFGLLVKNAFLSFITLGIYRFWARAALRRYWWGSVVIAGDPLEYTGTGLELFIGFLMFLGIMLPFGLVYGLTGFLQASNPLVGGLLRIAEALVFFVLIQFVTFRARRYRLSRTLWRGVRASQGGTSGEYLGLVIKWTLLSLITLGIAAPWARMATTRYLTDRTALGDLEARFDGRGRDLLVAWIAPYVLFIGAIVLFFVLNIGVISKFVPSIMPRGIWLLFIAYVGGGLGFLAYFLIELRYTIQHTRFGEVQLGSALRIGGLILQVIGFIFVSMLLIAFILVVNGICASWLGVDAEAPALLPSPALISAILGSVIIGVTGINILRILWLDRAVVRQICETLSLTNADRLDWIGQSIAPMPKAGEGMADALDIGAF